MPRSIFDSAPQQQPVAQSGSRRRSIFDDEEPESPGMVSRIISAVPQPVKTTVGTVLDYLGRPGAATAGAVAGALSDKPGEDGSALERAWANFTGKRRDDFDQVLEEQGVKDSFARNAAGFVGDVVLDPLNLVGVGEVKSLLGAGGKLAAKAATKAAEKALPEAALALGKRVVDDLGEKFVPRYGLEVSEAEASTLGKVGKQVDSPTAIKDEARRFQKERGTVAARMEHQAIEDFKPFKSVDERKIIQDDLNAGAGSTPEIDQFVKDQHGRQEAMFKREADNLVQKPEAHNPDYGAFWDFSPVKGTPKAAQLGPNSAMSAKLGPARKRKFENWADAKAAGAEQDAAVAWYHRLVKSETAVVTSKFAQDTAAKYGIKVEDLAGLNPADIATFRKLERFPAEEPLRKHLEEFVFPEKIAKLMDQTFAPGKQAGALGQIYEKALKVWRTQATVLRPGFHATNFQGNMFNSWLGGQVNPGRLVESVAWAAGKGPAKIGNYTSDEIRDYMLKYGVGGADHNFVTEMVGEGAENQLVRKLAGSQSAESLAQKALTAPLHPIKTAKAAVRGARLVGSTVEDTSKRALFFDALHKGMSLDDAAKNVDKFLFDYADLTQFEKTYMKKVFPFYTWMRKNVPLQVEGALTQPHKFAAVSKGQNAIENAASDDPNFVPQQNRTKYLQEAGAIQLPQSVAGMIGTDPKSAAFWSPYLPFQDLNKIPMPGGTDALTAARDIAGGVSPLPKGLIELLTNKSLFTNTPLYDSELGPVGDTKKITDSMDVLTRQIPGLQELLFNQVKGPQGKVQNETPALVRYLAQQFPVAEGAGKAAVSITRPEDAANPKAWLGQLAGVRVTEQDKAQLSAQKKGNRATSKRVRDKQRKQAPVKKTNVESAYDKYLSR